MTFAEIREQVQHVSEVWRSGTVDEQELDLVVLDDLLGELDGLHCDNPDGAERIEEVRGRIEILIDEIDISLGIEPPRLADDELGDPVSPAGESIPVSRRC